MSQWSREGAEPTTGRLLGERWRLGAPLGAGGMGALFLATHVNTGAEAVVKMMPPELASSLALRERFRQEAVVTARIRSDHIVRVYDAGIATDSGALFIVMERLVGEDLAALLAREGPPPKRRVLTLLGQLAHGLSRAHAQRVVHRDLKPSNLFLTERDDGSDHLKVLDFGIAKIVSVSRAETTLTAGSPRYMAPEQIQGSADLGPAVDRYAMAHIAYEMLVGEAYWQHQLDRDHHVYRLLEAIRAGAGPRATELARTRRGVDLPPAFDGWFARATHVDPAARPGDVFELVAEFGAALGLSR
ncbi:MAG: serine/threonine-protein kinase [Myxococcota bacterium]